MAEIIDELKFDYGHIKIKNIEYHRGIIPLPRGTICLETFPNPEQIFNVLHDFFKEIGIPGMFSEQDCIDWLLYFLDVDVDCVKFYTSYTEFLYPGSSDVGYNLEIDYVENAETEDIEEWINKLFEDIIKKVESRKFSGFILKKLKSFLNDERKYFKFVDRLYDAANSYIETLNSYFYAAEKVIYDYVEKLKSDKYKEEEEYEEEIESEEPEYETYLEEYEKE